MNKTELVQMLSEKHGISLKVGKEALEMVLDALTAAFEHGENVMLPGFGNFTIR